MSVEATKPADLTHRILSTIANEEGVDPIHLDPPLYDVIDGGLLDALLESNRDCDDEQTLRVEFTYHEYDVVVESDGTFSVDPV